jgi:hypothetical protein
MTRFKFIEGYASTNSINYQRRNKRLLRDVDLAELPHLLAFLLFLQKPLAREVGLRRFR